MKRNNKISKFKILLAAWTGGLLLGIVYWILRLFRRIEVHGFDYEKLKSIRRQMKEEKRGLVVVSNHPSMAETIFISGMFFPYFLFDAELIPHATPDRKFYNAWWFAPVRAASISIPRGEEKGSATAVKKMMYLLRSGFALVLFAEGGRTYKGNNFKALMGSNRKIRKIPGGIGRILEKSDPIILPIWTYGGDKFMPNPEYNSDRRYFPKANLKEKVIICVGKPVSYDELSKKSHMGDAMDILEDTILRISGPDLNNK